jgi:phosphoribosylformylglycinamidine (FGAM) synthase-like enzyme
MATNMATNEPQITPELVAAHGLKPDEYERILKLIGRVPTFTELIARTSPLASICAACRPRRPG